MNYTGIDYHKRYSVVCIIDATGSILHEERIEHGFSERFAALLGEYAPLEVAFEATMNWSWLYELLEVTEGIKRIVMANPLHVRLISEALGSAPEIGLYKPERSWQSIEHGQTPKSRVSGGNLSCHLPDDR